MKSRPPNQKLTTTSYALLGFLSLKRWTTYELAGQMGRGLGKFWPRARSILYTEPKKLIGLGLAEAKREVVGRRARTIYSITPGGRTELTAWLALPGAGPVLEWEQLVKVFFAESGSKADLLETLAGIRAWSAERLAKQHETATSYLEGGGPFQDRAAITALTGGFLAEFEALVGDWAARAEKVVGKWPEDISSAEVDVRIIERVIEMTGPGRHR